MPLSSTEIYWSLVAVIIVLTVLSTSIIVGMIIHSRKIKESENKFRLLFNRVNDALIVFDKNEKIVNLNESANRLLGYSQKELMSLYLKDVILKEKWLELHEEFIKIYENSDEYFGDTQLTTKEKVLIYVEVIAVNINLEGETYVMASYRDITQRKLAEKELKKKNIALQEVLAHIEEEKLKFKQQVAKTIDDVLMPTVNKLTNVDNKVNDIYYDLLKDNLQDLANASGGITHAYAKLTSREIEICNFIKHGFTSKEIANELNISLLTVNKHRERIRRKLVISNKNINLASYLKNI
ncbi:MAG: PAS domain S-box protein [candidate division Zixibacteria bacterium]|nr:PAS domain S-box protein [candidate division Zixibacteria bacterium]